MSDPNYHPGGDAQAIASISKKHFGGFKQMFVYHGWTDQGSDMMRKVQTRVVEAYGSVKAFEEHFARLDAAKLHQPFTWNDDISVYFTSFWGWTPDTWGAVGWSRQKGETRRENLIKQLSDPFICVCYVTSNRTETDPDLKGMMGGFYLMSHQKGDRNEFTHPIHHNREPEKWRHSLKAIRAFSYAPEYRPSAMDLFPELSKTARTVSSNGQIITDPEKISALRSIPWREVPVYSPGVNTETVIDTDQFDKGWVPSGPASGGGYWVNAGTNQLPRELYILRLDGDTDAYLGEASNDRLIVKIGLSVSPDTRRQAFQKAMPTGSFRWAVHRTTRKDGHTPYKDHATAVTGEMAMKLYLAENSKHLGGEFYLANKNVIDAAWNEGRDAAISFGGSKAKG